MHILIVVFLSAALFMTKYMISIIDLLNLLNLLGGGGGVKLPTRENIKLKELLVKENLVLHDSFFILNVTDIDLF